MTNDISKLPRWAQTLIKSQQRKISNLSETLDTVRQENGIVDTDVWIQKFEPGDIPLPKGSAILFGNRDHHFTAELLATGELAVRSSWGPVDIRPEASNSIRVALRERLRR